ncbi:hypothetical protein K8T06_00130 [bacterium]|nr:hypothetical protein [bacterium]
MKKILSLIIFGIVSSIGFVYSSDLLKIETVTFQTEIGKRVRAEITLHKYSAKNPLNYHYVWGSDLAWKPPKSIITNIEIFIANKKIRVPLSAYCDLTNFEKAWIESTDEGYLLIIRGGETSTGFLVKIAFDEFVRKRTVQLRTFPDSIWHETTYHYNTLNN